MNLIDISDVEPLVEAKRLPVGVGARLSYQRSSFFDGSAYLAAPAEARQRTDFGRPQASIRL
ncbi:hypothetical protein, partial [Agrobacterium vitis]|uniref:hypothetical protein n=1 Tax=Agrobacterium vitis TaxID=373 RepID=UPI001AEDAB76